MRCGGASNGKKNLRKKKIKNERDCAVFLIEKGSPVLDVFPVAISAADPPFGTATQFTLCQQSTYHLSAFPTGESLPKKEKSEI